MVDPSLEERGTTAFALARTIGDTETIREMLRKDADRNQRSRHELRPLSAAAKYGHTSVVKLLLDNGAEVTESTIFYVV
jgi:ankyrin repeat protein